MKEVRIIKIKAAEIITEIELRVTNPWEKRIYQDDKDDPWDYKYGICTLKENGVVDDHNYWEKKHKSLSNTKKNLEYQMHGFNTSKCYFGLLTIENGLGLIMIN
jgi:hypothetical protein